MDGISCFAIIIMDHIPIIRAIYSIQYPVSVPLRNQKLILLHYNMFPVWICLSCYFVMIFLFGWILSDCGCCVILFRESGKRDILRWCSKHNTWSWWYWYAMTWNDFVGSLISLHCCLSHAIVYHDIHCAVSKLMSCDWVQGYSTNVIVS